MTLLHVLELIFVVFLLFAWMWIVIRVTSDVFLSKDLSGMGKGIWVLFIILVPWLGVMCYLIFRGQSMGERSYTQTDSVAGSSTADELSKLAELRDKGVITDAEFNAQKVKLLS